MIIGDNYDIFYSIIPRGLICKKTTTSLQMKYQLILMDLPETLVMQAGEENLAVEENQEHQEIQAFLVSLEILVHLVLSQTSNLSWTNYNKVPEKKAHPQIHSITCKPKLVL